MSTATASPSAAAPKASLAASTRFGTFALVFGISVAILYVICDMAALPMFTYHPGTDRLEWGYAPARRDEGPAMYWYGWIAASILGGFVLGLAAAMLPEKIGRRIPLALSWIVPIALLPVLIYSLKFYWRW
ncbi:MAG: hypothetical protein WCG92_05240 [Hyphomicrobiales bacterium]